MDVIGRNLLRLLKCGAFDVMDDLELMSNFKWRKLLKISEAKGCPGIVCDGIRKYCAANNLTLNDTEEREWQQLISMTEQRATDMKNCIADMAFQLAEYYPILIQGTHIAMLYQNPLHYCCDSVKWWAPIDDKAQKMDEWAEKNGQILSDAKSNRLLYTYRNVNVQNCHCVVEFRSNQLTNALNDIVTAEISRLKPSYIQINAANVEILPATALILTLLMDIIRHLIYDEAMLQQFTDLGMLLRRYGDRVDYVKLEKWLDDLNMHDMTDLVGSMLISLFDFRQDEIPFMKNYDKKQSEAHIAHIFAENDSVYSEFDIGNRTKKGMKRFLRSTSKIKYNPHEVLGGYLQQIKKMFFEVEE